MQSESIDNDYLEMPFGPPPILPDIKTELREYIVYPEKLPIHQIDNVQQYWERQPQLLSLLKADLAPVGTTLKYERDPITGCIGDIQEVCLQNIGESVRNSMSMSRAPGPAVEGVRGNTSNFLFWPGGFDEPEKNMMEGKVEIDFDKNLKTLAKGFSAGIQFMSDKCTPKSFEHSCKESDNEPGSEDESINLMNVIDTEGRSLSFKPADGENIGGKENVSKKKAGNVDVPNMDEYIEPFKEYKIPVLKISDAHVQKNVKTEWAEQIDINVPVTDFDTKILEPAMTFPYELDNFQKQAIVKLEEQCDVFVAAHTSAGKTTIAEYAIAMSQKHMTRTIYTSPIKALSNQKFREFKEKFENVGLITGDLQINPTATCLIMTTEILQSMLYCAAEVLRDVEYVVFDEVHYINNEDRGHVWEEVIILLPPTISIVMLSATVPNPVEFAHWVGQIKRRKMYVISTLKRPVPLEHYLYIGFDKKTKDQSFLFINKDGTFLRESVKEAMEAWDQAMLKRKKMQQTKFLNTKHKPSLAIKSPIVPKNASVEETVNEVIASKEEEEAAEDKARLNSIAAKEKRMYSALLEHLESTDKLPVVIFTLSRNRCDKTAESFTESLLTHAQQKYVTEFFQQSIKHLKGTDSQLPQVIKMHKLLKLGIGVHHSGILPILKEIVEMLFQKGIVKVLFATETFAMGVNMPAKTVVFDSIEKYDGNAFRHLLPTEYIQMAGRAGRRGHDDIGTVMILCKKMVHEKELHDMSVGRPQNLVSKFKVTYAMVLHLKRLSEAISVGEMMRRSFKETKTMSNLEKNRNELEKVVREIEQAPALTEDQKQLGFFYQSSINYLSKWKELRPHMLEAKKAVKAMVEGRVLLISYQHHYNKLGILLGLQKKKDVSYKVFVLSSTEEEMAAKDNPKSETWHNVVSLIRKKFYQPVDSPTYNVLIVPASSIIEVTNAVLNVNYKLILADWDKRQIPRFKDALPGPSCLAAIEELCKLSKDVHKKSDVILPYLELKLNKFELQTKIIELNTLGNVLHTVISKIGDISNFEKEFHQVFQHKELEQKKQMLLKRLSDEYLGNYPEYESRVKVLRELKYIDHEDRVTLKGRVALEMGTYEIFLTELVLDNVLTNWQPEEIAAALSSLVFQKSNNEPKEEEIPRLNELRDKMLEVYERLVQIEIKYDLDPIAKPSFHLLRVVYEWARAKSFAKIMQLTDTQEGIIVRCIQQLNETLKDVRNAAIIIGHPALREKMEETSTKIKRDIVFTASLYTQD
ncbi:helicase SKI2W [Copidosoma floridanum]|uniref:helicase SKI2W n=1 Tax=Copidosoma floridanum TaxID=29053 RepID=UPI0006C9C1E3|nr:helicase SKI2W [Copidosoma floridanum]